MADMLVHLLNLPEGKVIYDALEKDGVEIFRPIGPDKEEVIAWVKEYSSSAAASECDMCFSNKPISCFIATRKSKMIGYACYDATAPNFFGPTKVLEEEQGKGIGKALLLKALWAMREYGYVYAIIGGIGPQKFYEKTVGATLIPNSTPGVYQFFLRKRK